MRSVVVYSLFLDLASEKLGAGHAMGDVGKRVMPRLLIDQILRLKHEIIMSVECINRHANVSAIEKPIEQRRAATRTESALDPLRRYPYP